MAYIPPPPPGPMQPELYPRVGPNYRGELDGYVYDYRVDRYRLNPKQDPLYEEPKKGPGLAEIALPGAAIAVAPSLMEAGVEAARSALSGAPSAAGNAAGSLFPSTGESVMSSWAPSVGETAASSAGSQGLAQGTFGLFEGLGSYAQPALGAAGAAAGLYGIYNASQLPDKKQAALMGGLSGAGAGVGTAIALGLSNPFTAPLAIGLGIGAVGAGLAAHKTTKERQKERWGDVGRPELAEVDKGGPNYRGQVFGQLPDDFVGFYDDPTSGQKVWVNNAFAKTRDEKYLKPMDIMIGPDNYRLSSNWDVLDMGKKTAFLQRILDEGLVSEKKGGIYYDDARAKEIFDEVFGRTSPKEVKEKEEENGNSQTVPGNLPQHRYGRAY